MEELVHRALSNAQVKEGTNEGRHEGSSDCGCVKRPDERGFASLLLRKPPWRPMSFILLLGMEGTMNTDFRVETREAE